MPTFAARSPPRMARPFSSAIAGAGRWSATSAEIRRFRRWSMSRRARLRRRGLPQAPGEISQHPGARRDRDRAGRIHHAVAAGLPHRFRQMACRRSRRRCSTRSRSRPPPSCSPSAPARPAGHPSRATMRCHGRTGRSPRRSSVSSHSACTRRRSRSMPGICRWCPPARDRRSHPARGGPQIAATVTAWPGIALDGARARFLGFGRGHRAGNGSIRGS